MSKHETWRTIEYWEKEDGLLIEEFVITTKSSDRGLRVIDGLIIMGEKKERRKSIIFNIKGRDIICIQTKKGRLGMSVMGQAFFSRELLKKNKPNSIRTVIICGKDDLLLREICLKYELEVVIIPDK